MSIGNTGYNISPIQSVKTIMGQTWLVINIPLRNLILVTGITSLS